MENQFLNNKLRLDIESVFTVICDGKSSGVSLSCSFQCIYICQGTPAPDVYKDTVARQARS